MSSGPTVASAPPPTHPPLVFTRVCKDWRAIALGTGSLWSCIDLYIGNPSMELRDTVHRVLATWSERARGCPLSWTLRGCSTLPPMLPEAVAQLHRLEMDVFMTNNLLPSAIGAIATGFPQLRELAFHVMDPKDMSVTVPQILASAPMLEAISLSFSAPATFTGATTPRLTVLKVDEITVSVLRALFQNCPMLTHLHITDILAETSSPPTAPLTATNLQTVVIPSDAAADETILQLAHFSFPSLKCLRLPYTPHLHVVSELFRRSACAVDTLSVNISSIGDVLELQTMYSRMPSITTLEIRRWERPENPTVTPLPEAVFDLSVPGVLPRLRHLTIHIGGIKEHRYNVPYTGVILLLNARSGPNSAFRSFRLDVKPAQPIHFHRPIHFHESYTPPATFLS
ncbi:hypothetical protein B0H11DRAFT_1332300 [Mycena galericulata]|nr:hypothetical protein B0H11DRAFT_1332300 [Mycena galericulata]